MLLPRIFIKNYQNIEDKKVRLAWGNLASIFGIVTNIMLGIVKVIFGLIVKSSAILADGVNNSLDAFNSILSLIGFKISGKQADDDHPFGHQRMEYVIGLIVSCIILIVGLTFFKDSFLKTISFIKKESEPLIIDKPLLIIGLLILSIIVKIIQSIFYKKVGKTINSMTVIANSKDSLNDSIATIATLISVIIYVFTPNNINIDSIAGLIVSGFIIFTGIDLVKETIDPLIGVVPGNEEVKKITSFVLSYDGVLGIHDLVIHSYGPNMNYVTIHVEVSRYVDVMESHDMIDNIEHDAKKTLGIELVIHMDPVDDKDPILIELKDKIYNIIKSIDSTLEYHDLRIVSVPTHTNIVFDIVMPVSLQKKQKEIESKIKEEINKINNKYFAVINFDQFYNKF